MIAGDCGVHPMKFPIKPLVTMKAPNEIHTPVKLAQYLSFPIYYPLKNSINQRLHTLRP